MVSIFSPNIQLEQPARGDQSSTWETPVNSNATVMDLCCGGNSAIALAGVNVILSSTQYRSRTITLTSTLTASVSLTLPTSFVKSYEILNLCTGSSAFTVTLKTTATGGQVICAPPGETSYVLNNAGNISFRNLGRVGEYWDHAGSSVPSWVSGCTVPPYLNCDGTTFSSSTYPQLAITLGTTTLPDSKGRTRFVLNQGTARVSTAISGINGDVLFASGGNEAMHQHNHGVTDPTHTHGHNANANTVALGQDAGGVFNSPTPNAGTISNAFTGITINNNGAGGTQNMSPAYIGGVTMIRAA